MCVSPEKIPPISDSFVIISGDSDFSPLVSKLRENNKLVIGVGVKNSTSDLLIANCDEFIFYDDLVREQEAQKKRAVRKAPVKAVNSTTKATASRTANDKQQEAFELVVETVEALLAERGEEEKMWASMVKQTMKRRKPDFNESYYDYRTFSELLEDAQQHKLLVLTRADKGGYIVQLPNASK
jgi:hypothetical protein